MPVHPPEGTSPSRSWEKKPISSPPPAAKAPDVSHVCAYFCAVLALIDAMDIMQNGLTINARQVTQLLDQKRELERERNVVNYPNAPERPGPAPKKTITERRHIEVYDYHEHDKWTYWVTEHKTNPNYLKWKEQEDKYEKHDYANYLNECKNIDTFKALLTAQIQGTRTQASAIQSEGSGKMANVSEFASVISHILQSFNKVTGHMVEGMHKPKK